MSFGRDFEQSPMNSFVFQQGNQSTFTTPIKDNTENNENQNIGNMHNDNNQKATKYDYLDYGNYINRVLSSQLLSIDSDGGEINWNLPRTADKVNIVNAMLALIESKKLYQSLLQQSSDTIENIKIELHTNEIKIKSLSQQNKQLNSKMNVIFQRKQFLEIELKKQTNLLKDTRKSLNKEIEQLKYRDKKYQNNIRKKENIHKAQQEKIKKLLDERDKKSYKCLSFKLLNTNTMSNNSNPNPQSTHLLNENNMLQSQIAHLQKQLQTVLNENNLLRESLLKLEVNCKETLNKINDLFANNNSNNIQNINRYKYAMPFDENAQNLIGNDIEQSSKHLSQVLDQLKHNIDETNNTHNLQRMKSEIMDLQKQVTELTETNKEYETLIRTYVNSE